MKNILLGLLFVLLIGAGIGGTWYYMNMNVEAANERTNAVQAELSTSKTQIAALEADMKLKADFEAAEQQLLVNFEAFMALGGSGADMESLENYYDSSVLVEGDIAGASLRTYGLALQKYSKSLSSNEGVKATPVKLASGEWTAIVSLVETNLSSPLTLSQSGTILKAPATRVQQELVLTLAKWSEGKIVEQYEFPYAQDASKSNLLKYITTTGSGDLISSEKKMMNASDTSSDTPIPVEKELIENTPAKIIPTKVETGTGTNPDKI